MPQLEHIETPAAQRPYVVAPLHQVCAKMTANKSSATSHKAPISLDPRFGFDLSLASFRRSGAVGNLRPKNALQITSVCASASYTSCPCKTLTALSPCCRETADGRLPLCCQAVATRPRQAKAQRTSQHTLTRAGEVVLTGSPPLISALLLCCCSRSERQRKICRRA